MTHCRTILLASCLLAGWSAIPAPAAQAASPAAQMAARVARIPAGQAPAPASASIAPAAENNAPAPAGRIEGIVHSGKFPLPGATVIAANTLTGQRVVTSTALDGAYVLDVPARGRYVVKVKMTAFAVATQEVLVHPPSPPMRADFDLVLESRAQPGAGSGPVGAAAGQNLADATGLGALQGMLGGAAGAVTQPGSATLDAASAIPGGGADQATESVNVSGATAGGDAPLSTDELQERMREFRDSRGGFGGGFGGRGGGFRGGPAVFLLGGGRRFNINQPHGSLYYNLNDAPFDARPYSISGIPVPKPAYNAQRFGGNLGGILRIPHLYSGKGSFFFVNYNGTRAENPFDLYSTVPTLLERAGNFSQATLATASGTQPVQIYDPRTGSQFAGNVIPQDRIAPASTALLHYIPLPNLPGDTQNFHYAGSTAAESNDLNVRVIHNFAAANGPMFWRGPRNNLNVGFHYHGGHNELSNAFPTIGGGTDTRSFDVPLGYIRGAGHFTNILRFDFNRSRISTHNLYAFADNIEGLAGISGVSANPFDWGLPRLSFSHFTGTSDVNPLLSRDQTFTYSDGMVYRRTLHAWRWGFDYRRVDLNRQTDSNARGAFVFTGFNTAQSAGRTPVPGTGFDLADFLLGLPQQTSAQYGDGSDYFRQNVFSAYMQDNWHARANLSLVVGLRYEYASPFTEAQNRLVNLDVAPGFTAAAPVIAGQVAPFSGALPLSLIRPDRDNFAPRVGLAWKPQDKTILRAGYGINFNTGAYSAMAQQMALQPPFDFTQTNIESPRQPLTLAAGFPAPAPGLVTNNYGVNPDYQLGYVQNWNLDVERELNRDTVLNLDYTGARGTRLDIIEAPNRSATGLRIPGVQAFEWQSSDGDSITHAGSVRLRRRLHDGFSVGGTYTWAKAIDNASTIGGGATVVAQNAFDLAAERGLSSFDQRHRVSGDYLWEMPWGPNRHFRPAGPLGAAVSNWQLSGGWSYTSGFPYTARVLGSFTDVSRGTNGTLRADATGAPVTLANPTFQEFFNTAAFALPPAGAYGTAGRNTIPGPASMSVNSAITRTVSLGEFRVLELRMQGTNIFNAPNVSGIDTTVNSPTFGRVLAVGTMRQLQFVARLRF
jgi:hypothetical protein